MKNAQHSIEKLVHLFSKRQVLTLPEIKETLNTNSNMTVYRKLKTINYHTSYSHSGKYYVLNDAVKYNRNGLWEFNGIFFSKYGKLAPTIVHLVNFSSAGYFAAELKHILKVTVHNELRKLSSNKQLRREQIGSEFLYLSTSIGEVQLKTRISQIQTRKIEDPNNLRRYFDDDDIENLNLFLKGLNEKQRRLFLGFQSLHFGYGGDRYFANISGIDVRTIAKGRRELRNKNVSMERIRNHGAGRKPLKKK